MLNLTSAALKVFRALDPCDMRKSFNGLHTLASDQLLTATTRDALLVFTNIHEHYKTQRPASNVAQALGYTLNQWEKIRHCLSQGVL